ncbi:MAG: leucine-rich repeat domain-containing protein [Ruminococcaceae bacterium]|nr:leucine-rich repeat domain-containing protein [Oscillospiraceae bacterium]
MTVPKQFLVKNNERSVFGLNLHFSSGLEYIYDSPTTVIVNGIGYCDDSEIVVPDRLPNGKIVVGVAEKAFFRCDGIKSVNLPYTVNTIGAYSFSWCSDLERIIAPGVVFIEERAFMGCKQLHRIELSRRLESVEDKAFSYCTGIEDITLPDSLFYMGVGVFEGCKKLESVALPAKLCELNNSMFNACVNLKSVKLPKSLRYIDEYAFAYCVSLENMVIPRMVVVNSAAFYESGFNPEQFKVS